MNDFVSIAIGLIGLLLLVNAIYTSSRRLASFGYAVLAFGLVVGLGIGAIFILMPDSGSVVETNRVLDMIGAAITIGAPLAGAWGASHPPRRGKA